MSDGADTQMRSQTQDWVDVCGYRWLGEKVQDVCDKVQTKHVAWGQMEQIPLSEMRFQFQFPNQDPDPDGATYYVHAQRKQSTDRSAGQPPLLTMADKR